jgi:hypothetical protein
MRLVFDLSRTKLIFGSPMSMDIWTPSDMKLKILHVHELLGISSLVKIKMVDGF